MTRRPLIAGNWKMNGMPDWVYRIAELATLMPAKASAHLDLLICPPSPLIGALCEAAKDHHIHIGAQDCHAAMSGAHTGETSPDLIKALGANFVILGHSERRAAGETDADVRAKAVAARQVGLTPIICLGESLAQREAGQAAQVVKAQFDGSVPDLDEYVIAYEPIWAIGTGQVATLDDIAEIHGELRALVGPETRLLYGGSVKPGNAEGILGLADVDGALIGGASLKMDSLAAIAQAAPK